LFKSFIKHRPKQLLAVYVEPHQVDVLRARRKWRSWQTESVEQFTVPNGEVIYDFLQKLNLRPRGSKATALLLLLPRLYYGFHREHYPASLSDNLEEALSFDWPENVFHEPEQTLHFFGQAASIDHHLSVPIFSLRYDIYEKFYQALAGSNFQTFNVLPAAPGYSVLLRDRAIDQDSSDVEICGRIISSSCLEVNKFYKGLLLDSTVVRNDGDQLRLFRESLRGLDEVGAAESVHIHLICQAGERNKDHVRQWQEQDLPLSMVEIENPLITHWIERLLTQDTVQTFNPPLLLKPWEIPKAAYIVFALILFYSLYALYQTSSYDRLWESSQLLNKQRAQLEAQWKPIEQLQSRISKFQEDQNALAQFGGQGYPMLGLLTLLTEVTPQDTWLNYLSLRERELTLRGESSSAIKYLTELSKVKGFEDVRFASPVTRNPSSDKERFNVQVRLNLQVLQGILETIPLEGGAVDIAQLGAPDGSNGSADEGQPPSAHEPGGTTTPEAAVAGSEDDNATMSIRSPQFGDDNATLNRSVE
jgi:general secretion pathway protein L